jgi:hypothetical protein
MKKIFILFLLAGFALSVMGQAKNSTTTMLSNETTKVISGLAATDTVSCSNTIYWTFAINKPYLAYYAFAVKMTTLGTSTKAHAYIDVLGSLDGTNWVATGTTQVKYGGGADSLFQMVDVTTGVLWKYLKLQIAGKATGGVTTTGSKVTALAVKVAKK